METLTETLDEPMKVVVKRKPGRPTADTEINIEHLCDVAVNVFAEKGYTGTTTTEITKKAGVARSLIHYYFGNKEELWKASIKRIANEFIKEFESSKKIHKDLDGTQMIKVVVRQLYILKNFVKPLWALTGELFKKQRKRGTIKKIDKEFQSHILLGMASNLFSNPYMTRHLYNIDPFNEEVIERYADTVVEIFCHGMVKE